MKRFPSKQIVDKLRKVDIELGRGASVPEVCRITEARQQTCYRWRLDTGRTAC